MADAAAPQLMRPAPRIEEIIGNPDLLLHRIDVQREELVFARVTPETYTASTFLDARMQYAGGDMLRVPISAVPQMVTVPPSDHRPVQYIFHTSFCCSTLLARSLLKPGVTHVLREPWAVAQMCNVKKLLTQQDRWKAEGPGLVDLMLRLLTKTYDPHECTIIKPANLASEIARELLAARPRSHALLMYSGLEDFLVSSLKMDSDIQAKLPNFAVTAAGFAGYFGHFPELGSTGWSRLQAAVVLWHAQMLHFKAVFASHPARAAYLNAGTLLSRPRETLAGAARFFELDPHAETLASVVDGPVWRSHAKRIQTEYDPAEREREFKAIYHLHHQEIGEALAWAEPLLARMPVLPLPGNALDRMGGVQAAPGSSA